MSGPDTSSDFGEFTTPDWVKDAVFYQIFPDRFARAEGTIHDGNFEPWDTPPSVHGFKGGNLLGIMEHLDYLQDLGVNALYLCPVFASTANHRYHTHDYFTIDPILGGEGAFQALLAAAHRRGMRIVLDGVFNHASRGFFQFNHVLENGDASPYRNWFTIYSYPLHPYGPESAQPGYKCWWNMPALPEFNTDLPEVREFLWGIAEYWLKQGIDGWRLDVPNQIDDVEFWREFRRRCKAINPDAYIVGEIWEDARRWLQGDQFDAVMNYPFTRATVGFFGAESGIDAAVIGDTGLAPIKRLDAPAFRQSVDWLFSAYVWSATLSQLNLLGSHDTPRFLSIVRGDETALRLAFLFQIACPGVPCIYYGDEIGLTGGRDPDCRASFLWNDSLWNVDLRDFVKRCVRLRHERRELRHGSYESLIAGGGTFAFMRKYHGEVTVIVLNASSEDRLIDLSLAQPFQLHHGFQVAEPAPEVSDTRISSWKIPARSGSILFGCFPSESDS